MLLGEIGAKVALGVGPALSPRNPADDVAFRESRDGLGVNPDQGRSLDGGDRRGRGKRLGKAALCRRA